MSTKLEWRAVPAELTSTSNGSTSSTKAFTAALSVMSSATPSAAKPASASSLTTVSTSLAVRAAMVTAAPASARATAAPSPMPRVPPVTRARLPSRRKLGVRGRVMLFGSLGARRCSGPIGHVAAAIAAHADIGLLGMADKALEHREARAIFADHRRGFVGRDGLPRTGLHEFPHPQATRIARRLHRGESVIGADDLITIGNIGAWPEKQRAIIGDVVAEPHVAVGHHLHML